MSTIMVLIFGIYGSSKSCLWAQSQKFCTKSWWFHGLQHNRSRTCYTHAGLGTELFHRTIALPKIVSHIFFFLALGEYFLYLTVISWEWYSQLPASLTCLNSSRAAYIHVCTHTIKHINRNLHITLKLLFCILCRPKESTIKVHEIHVCAW